MQTAPNQYQSDLLLLPYTVFIFPLLDLYEKNVVGGLDFD
jgi:hypothetical protein